MAEDVAQDSSLKGLPQQYVANKGLPMSDAHRMQDVWDEVSREPPMEGLPMSVTHETQLGEEEVLEERQMEHCTP